MQDFIFNGISASSMGVILEDEWTKITPSIKREVVSIDGRHGSLYTALNFEDIARSINAILLNPQKEDDVIKWLSGEGKFIINGRTRIVRIFDSIEFQKLGPFKKKFSIPVIMEPFCYSGTDSPLINTNKGIITNIGNIESLPILKINSDTPGNTITINGLSFTINKAVEDFIIDCKNKTETDPEAITIGYQYPSLLPGENIITSTKICELIVDNKDWWIA